MAKRVLCILGKLKAGGVESIMFSYYRCLDKSKYQYDFVYEESSIFDIPKDILDMGARSYKISDVSSPFKYMRELRKIVKEGNYSIVHSNLNTLSVFSLFAAYLGGAKYRILHNHSTSSNVEKKRDFIKKLLIPVNRIMTNKPAACSELAARWMYGDRAVEKGKVKVFRNGVDVEKFSFSEDYRNGIRKEFDLEGKRVIGHIGRFMTQKNHMFIIDAFSEYIKTETSAVLMLVGGGELYSDVCEYVKEKGVSENVIFAGIRKDVWKLYSAFDVFILPSLYEGLPVVAMEALASGLPVLLSDKVTKECAISENVSFIEIDDPAKWASAIANASVSDRTAAARAMANGDYNINKCAKELCEYYDSFE